MNTKDEDNILSKQMFDKTDSLSVEKPNIVYATMEVKHISQAIDLQKASNEHPWEKDAFETELTNGVGFYKVALDGDTLVGFAGAWAFFDEMQIVEVLVHPKYRSLGIGRKIFHVLMEQLVSQGCQWGTLEVRWNNEPALAIYKKYGFVQCGIRKKYYDGVHDALVMRLDNMQSKGYKTTLENLNAEQ